LINRMGFNSDGAQTVASRLKALSWDHGRVPLGVNLGKNKTTADEASIDDYLQGFEAFRGLGQYYVINVSSPNTPGLRSLANPDFLRLMADSFGNELPKMWVKLDPDMPRRDLRAIVECIAEVGYQGIILSNTHRVVWPEVGGQSGHPIMTQATRALETAYEVHQGKLPMIASGGILSGADIFQKLIRGAQAVQIYTALVYGGPWVVHHLLRELAEELKLAGFASAEDAVGSFYQ